jgi:hypothetical protein
MMLEEFRTKYTRILTFIFVSNEASVLDHVDPIVLFLTIHTPACN